MLHPLAAYLLHRGLPTLPLRVRRAQESAAALAGRLAAHPAVARVHYPGLAGGDPRGLVGRQMDGPGPMLAFEVRGRARRGGGAHARLAVVTPAVSLGSTDTLIQHPAGLTQRVVEREAGAARGVAEGLLRLAVGLEDAGDLWADLAGGLDAAARADSVEGP